jgi:hypothetical protein
MLGNLDMGNGERRYRKVAVDVAPIDSIVGSKKVRRRQFGALIALQGCGC